MDDFLKVRLDKYDEWISGGKISFSSKVIPIHESLDARQWVLTTEHVANILHNAHLIALQKCMCRAHYARCDKPSEVCLVLNRAGEKLMAKGEARRISLSEALEVLRNANEAGLVHLTLYKPDHEVFALCSCCSCCCHDIQLVKKHNRADLMVRSEYIAVTNMDTCIHCGTCAERCIFDARIFENERMQYHAEACLGCGLCVTTCPSQSIMMEQRKL